MSIPNAIISALPQHVGTRVTVRGWVAHLRSSGKVAFVVMRDGSGTLQCVLVKNQLAPEAWARFADLTQETSVAITGDVRAEPRAPGGHELGVTDVEILGRSPIDYPIQPKEHGIDFLLDHRHLWLRSPRQAAILRIRHEVEQAIHDFFYARDFVHVDTPILTGAIGERSGTLLHGVFRRGERVSRANGSTVRGGGGGGAWADLHLRPHVPRREVQDSAPPDRVLDDRTGDGVLRYAR